LWGETFFVITAAPHPPAPTHTPTTERKKSNNNKKKAKHNASTKGHETVDEVILGSAKNGVKAGHGRRPAD